MRRFLTVVCFISLCAIPSLAGKKASRPPAMTDQQFVEFAGQTDMTDANLAQLAQTAAESQPVKKFAQELVVDRTSDFQRLSDVAHKASLSMPSAIDAEHNRAIIEPFHKIRGTGFDRRFMEEMVARQFRAIAVYKKEAADAQSPALRSYAEGDLLILHGHLVDAKNIEKVKPRGNKRQG